MCEGSTTRLAIVAALTIWGILPSSAAATGEEAAAFESADSPPAGELPPPEPDYDALFDEEFDDAVDIAPTWDPLEGMNRAFFRFNRWLDGMFWEPVTDAYRFAVPEVGRRAVRRVFLNVNSAPVFVNDVLQLRFDDAAETLGRFVLNSTVGCGGIFDAGIEAGWEFHDSDFGETLALYGAPTGPYLVIPVFGPSTVRDGLGDVVDRLFDPLTYIFGIGLIGSSIQIAVGTGTGITTYEAHADDLDQLEASSIDYYSALRSVYLQTRAAEVREVVEDSWLRRKHAERAAPAPPQESSPLALPAASSETR